MAQKRVEGDVPGPVAQRGRVEGGVSPLDPVARVGTCGDELLGPWPGRDVIVQMRA